jgi:hypothetical protein
MLRDVGEGPVSRWLSALLVTAYIAVAFVAGGSLLGVTTAGACLLPWMCVWFPGAMGSYTVGQVGMITSASPATMVWLMGWVVLLLPVIVILFLWTRGLL